MQNSYCLFKQTISLSTLSILVNFFTSWKFHNSLSEVITQDNLRVIRKCLDHRFLKIHHLLLVNI